jgi:hypothetical protein
MESKVIASANNNPDDTAALAAAAASDETVKDSGNLDVSATDR